MVKDNLTNEDLGKKFKSQFELVNYAIKLAENMIKTGRGPRVKIEAQNTALQIVAEIAENADVMDEIPVMDPVDENVINSKFAEEKIGKKSYETPVKRMKTAKVQDKE